MPAIFSTPRQRNFIDDLPTLIAACRDQVAELDMHDITVRELFDALETGLAAALRLKLERRRERPSQVLQ